MSEIKPGLSAELSVKVSEDSATRHVSGVSVFTTPHLIGLLERTCMAAVQPWLGEGESTVGIGINMRHLAATPVGMTVTAKCRLEEVKRRVLVFAVEAYDEVEKVAEGTHWRAIVKPEEIAEKMRRKAGLGA